MRLATLLLASTVLLTGCSYLSGGSGGSGGRDTGGGGSSGSGNSGGGNATATYSGTVTGKASYRERIMLPPDASVRALLLDATKPGSPPLAIAEQQFATGGKGPPYDITLKYDPAKINAQGIYHVQVDVLVRGKPRFVTSSPPRVITGGNASTFDIVLTAARQ